MLREGISWNDPGSGKVQPSVSLPSAHWQPIPAKITPYISLPIGINEKKNGKLKFSPKCTSSHQGQKILPSLCVSVPAGKFLLPLNKLTFTIFLQGRDCSWHWELSQRFPKKLQPSCARVSISFPTFRPLRRLTTHRVTLRSLTRSFGFFWYLLKDSAHGLKPLHSNEVPGYESCLNSIGDKNN